jgi:hypothetical protein
MWTLPKRVLSTLGDATVGAAIVMVHVLLSERERLRASERRRGARAGKPPRALPQ